MRHLHSVQARACFAGYLDLVDLEPLDLGSHGLGGCHEQGQLEAILFPLAELIRLLHENIYLKIGIKRKKTSGGLLPITLT